MNDLLVGASAPKHPSTMIFGRLRAETTVDRFRLLENIYWSCTYIRVLADLLDDILVEVTGVSHQRSTNVVCVLHTLEESVDDRQLRALTQLNLGGLDAGVKILDPIMVSSSQILVDVVLEDDNVGVWDFLCVDR